ncbi:ion transporter, partial [Desulfobacterales bacterium HSG17]|nr:ion transporter [Desulfobacterales bacterium HSG17]
QMIYIIDLFFFMDIVLNFFTTFRYQGIEIKEKKETAKHYLKTMFTVDIIANIPIELIFILDPIRNIYHLPLVLLLRLPRLLRIARMILIFRRWGILTWINPGILRISKLILTVLILNHWLACIWFLTASTAGFPENCWAVREAIHLSTAPTQYLRSLYWTITTMTTVGYGDITPVLDIEYLLAILVMMMGASMYAFIIGNIASLFSNLDSTKSNFFNKIESVTQYLKSRQVPHDLILQLRRYYEYQWDIHKGGKENELLDDLPVQFRLKILRHLIRELIEQVPLFKYCSPALRNELLTALKPQTYAPGIYIAREGETGKELFFISTGQAEITSDKGQKKYGFFESGDYFGDLSLILNEKRTASVIAVSYCETFVLNRDDFIRIKKEYSELSEVLKKTASEKTDKISALILDGVTL